MGGNVKVNESFYNFYEGPFNVDIGDMKGAHFSQKNVVS